MPTRTHFKNTDRNSYIPTSSGHHPKWIRGILKGQLKRIKRNCDQQEDYDIQSDMLLKLFAQKEYKCPYLQRLQEEIGLMDRGELLTPKPRKKADFVIVFCTEYNRQYKQIEKVVRTHWPILMRDPILAKTLPN